MKSTDQFHVGIVVDDFDRTLADLSRLLGHEWSDPMTSDTPVQLADGTVEVTFHLTFSTTTPRLEIIRTVPGTLWTPVATSGIHHFGFWSEDLEGDSADLAAVGYQREATGLLPDGTVAWAYHRGPEGPRIEIVSRALKGGLEAYWAPCGHPAPPADG